MHVLHMCSYMQSTGVHAFAFKFYSNIHFNFILFKKGKAGTICALFWQGEGRQRGWGVMLGLSFSNSTFILLMSGQCQISGDHQAIDNQGAHKTFLFPSSNNIRSIQYIGTFSSLVRV